VHAVAEHDQSLLDGRGTDGCCFRNGADFDHAGSTFAPAALNGKRLIVGRFEAAEAAEHHLVADRDRRGDVVVLERTDHSTVGAAGPGLPSVLPVRWGLPRYVAHGPGSAAVAGAARRARTRSVCLMASGGREPAVRVETVRLLLRGHRVVCTRAPRTRLACQPGPSPISSRPMSNRSRIVKFPRHPKEKFVLILPAPPAAQTSSGTKPRILPLQR
jgi:hypothetical protein